MSSAEITHESPYGKIVSAWSKTGDKVTWKVVVPPNSSATALLPARGPIRENGKPLEEAGLQANPGNSGTTSVELAAGAYAFEFDLSPKP
jgi:alpha-L-rhamnosidase